MAYIDPHKLKVQPAGPINPPPLVTGHDLVRHGLSPGSHFATILEQVREAQLDRTIKSKREALEWIDRRWPPIGQNQERQGSGGESRVELASRRSSGPAALA